MDFEKAMNRLNEISSLMRQENTSLEELMKLYKEAAELTAKCKEYIANAKLVVEQLEAAE